MSFVELLPSVIVCKVALGIKSIASARNSVPFLVNVAIFSFEDLRLSISVVIKVTSALVGVEVVFLIVERRWHLASFI